MGTRLKSNRDIWKLLVTMVLLSAVLISMAGHTLTVPGWESFFTSLFLHGVAAVLILIIYKIWIGEGADLFVWIGLEPEDEDHQGHNNGPKRAA